MSEHESPNDCIEDGSIDVDHGHLVLSGTGEPPPYVKGQGRCVECGKPITFIYSYENAVWA